MARRKFSTLIDEDLYRRTRFEALRQDRQISDVVCEALGAYLAETQKKTGPEGAVAQSWGVLPWPAAEVRRLLREEEGLLDG